MIVGSITRNREQDLVALAKTWLDDRAEGSAAYRAYLERWGDWQSPWGE